jgi:hypothetical protein
VQVHKGGKQALAFQNEKGRVLRTPALGSLIFRAQGWYPHPLPAMTKLFDATCINEARTATWRKRPRRSEYNLNQAIRFRQAHR